MGTIRVSVEQVQDLREGDVVTIRNVNWPEGATVTGPLYSQDYSNDLFIAGHPIKTQAACGTPAEFILIARTPRPVYVNHPRTESAPRDVVRDADDEGNRNTWFRTHDHGWRSMWTPINRLGRDQLPDRLRLLVDGETGQVVPS